VPGYTSHQGLAWLRRDIERLSPDIVTACFGWNDINRRARTDREAMPMHGGAVMVRRVLSSSQLLIRLGVLVRRMAPAPASAVDAAAGTMRVPRDEYVQNLLEMAALARAQGAVPVLIGPVYRDRVAHPPEGDDIAAHRAALRAAAGAQGIAYVEIPELTEDAHPANASLFEEHIHPNAKGHRLMAEALLRLFAEKSLVSGLRVEVPRPGVRLETAQEAGR
jgi:lysophospholipase L1-like esterase